jgi:cell division protein FtsB
MIGEGTWREVRMRRSKRLLALLLLVAFASPARGGDADAASMEILRNTIQSNKKALVDVNLALTDEEAQSFWPVYDRYQADLIAVNDRLLRVIADYAANFESITDEKANQLVDEYLAAERDRVEVRRRYREPIAKTLPGRKLMRFYQIENKIDAVLRFELAATIPVVES